MRWLDGVTLQWEEQPDRILLTPCQWTQTQDVVVVTRQYYPISSTSSNQRVDRDRGFGLGRRDASGEDNL